MENQSILHRNTQLETSTWSKQRRINNTSSSKQQELENEQSQQNMSGHPVRKVMITFERRLIRINIKTPLMTWVMLRALRVASSTMSDGIN